MSETIQDLPDDQKLEMVSALNDKIKENESIIWKLAEENDVMRKKIHELIQLKIVKKP